MAIGDENKFDGEKVRLDLVEPSLIEAIGKVRTYGVKKYGDDMVITLFINDIINLSSTQKKYLKIGGIR